MGTVYWQQAAGDKDRNYVDVCLQWNVILNGPGYAGPLPECTHNLKSHGWTPKKITGLLQFSQDMAHGDIVVLRVGTSEIAAIGIICGHYQWHDIFGDVDGWDLQHVRRVNWIWKRKKGTNKKFPTYTLKLGDTTQKLNSKIVIDWIKSLNLDFDNTTALAELPEEAHKEESFESIFEFLYDQGISSTSIATLNKEINELIRIAKWYQKTGAPSEFETVAYLAVPLLRALGWTPQKMAIEWNKVDIALFNELPREDRNLGVVVEAKKKGNSCLSAFSQAERYSIGKNSCHRLIVTDGLRYGVYLKQDGQFNLHAYFNLTRLRSDYPIYGCHGVKEALLAMTPEWI